MHRHLAEVAGAGPSIVGTEGLWLSGMLSLQLPGHRLVLGGVAPGVVWDLLAMANRWPPGALVLAGSGRYGPFGWVTIEGDFRQVVLARHVRLYHDRGGGHEGRVDVPVLSGAC